MYILFQDSLNLVCNIATASAGHFALLSFQLWLTHLLNVVLIVTL